MTSDSKDNASVKDAAHGLDAAAVMALLPARPRLLALGEPTHGEDVLLEVRNDLFQRLVEQEGYRTIAIESDCVTGLIVDDYVTSGTGTLDEVMAQGFSHGFGASAANRELVRWMRAYNDGRPASERLRFAGFDGPLEMAAAASPRQALTALLAYLTARVDCDLLPCTLETLDRLLRSDDRWTNPAVMTDPSQSVGRAPEATQLRLLADGLGALLDTQVPHLIAASSPDEWDRARMYARTATGLLRYHSAMADTSPGRLAHLLGVRASMMAANLLALAERGPLLAHAHNGHLQRDKSSMRMGGPSLHWWSAGAIVSARLGQGYAFIATGLGTIHHRGVHTPPPDTLEGLLYALPQDRYLLDPRKLAAVLGDTTPTPRESAWFGYAPLDPTHLANIDGIVFVKDAPQSQG
jgi:erythromycin esterase-like protein